MKLEEIIGESLNTEFSVIWKNNNGYFSLDDREYLIKIEKTDITELNINFNELIEITFLGKDKGSNLSYSYKGTKNQPLSHLAKIFSTLVIAVEKKLSFSNFNIIYFSAKRNDGSFGSRRKMYNTLTKVLSKKLDINREVVEYSDLEVYFLSKKELSIEQAKSIIKEVIE